MSGQQCERENHDLRAASKAFEDVVTPEYLEAYLNCFNEENESRLISGNAC